MRSFVNALLSVAALALFAEDAAAMDKLSCVNYSLNVLSQKARARALGCPVDTSTPQWSDNERDHYEACLQAADQEVLNGWQAARDKELQRCRACTQYATDAMAAVEQNRSLHCGFKGDPWRDDLMAHYEFCVALADGTFLKTIATQTDFRSADIENCKRHNARQIQICELYVAKSKDAAQRYARWRCDLLAGQVPQEALSGNDKTRFAWCMDQLPYGTSADAVDSAALANVQTALDSLVEVTSRKANKLSACQFESLMRAANQKRNTRSVNAGVLKSIKAPPGGSGASNKSDAHGSRSRVLGPGLLDAERGFVRQSPGATGVPAHVPQSGNINLR